MNLFKLVMLIVLLQLSSTIWVKAQSNKIVVFDSIDTITLNHSEFKITDTKVGIELLITNKNKLTSIYKLIDPCIKFYSEKEILIARGLPIFSSFVPENADYFFAFFDDKKIPVSKNDTIEFRKTPK